MAKVEANVRAGRRIILIEGCGRAADAIVSLLKRTTSSAVEVRELREPADKAGLARRPELFQLLPLAAGPTGLRDALLAALATPAPSGKSRTTAFQRRETSCVGPARQGTARSATGY